MRTPALLALTLVLFLPLVAVANPGSTFVRGELGFVDPAPQAGLDKSQSADLFTLSTKNFLQSFAVQTLGATGEERFEMMRTKTDSLGMAHTRFQQELHGLRVVGAQMLVHSNAATGAVYAVNGDLAISAGVPLPSEAGFSPLDKRDGLRQLDLQGRVVETPELLYFYDAELVQTFLVWRLRMVGTQQGEFFDRDIYVDAVKPHIVASVANFHTAKSRRSYDGSNAYLNNQGGISGLPGVLLCTDSQSCGGDASAQRAHDGAGAVYDYYQARFGRDGINDSGMTMISSVHVDDNWPNAAWYANQMVYGDGNGTTLGDLTLSFDVIAHELTHGVTDFESDLIYQKESGALNEALSDIFGVAADSYNRGGVVDSATWKLGEEAYTPGTAGDALRYMNNPTQDGYSTDYYPERLYPGSCTPSQNNDSCGVHGNSGIANLAFYLMVEGGTHPRGKTTAVVDAIGMAKAEQIFYRAQTTYLTASSNFSAARTATSQAATDLYGAAEAEDVETAWCAVGVGSCPTGGGGGGGGGGSALQNGVPVSGLSGSTGSEVSYTIDVPAGASDLSIATSGGSGDADLYVKFGSAPTTSSYDCRPYKSGNNETCTFATPQAGTYHVMIRAYSTYSGMTLTASFTEPSGGGGGGGGGSALSNGVPVTGLSGSTGGTVEYTIDVPAGASDLTIAMSGGSGDADLYVRFGSAPTTSTYDCRPYKSGNNETCTFATPQAGTYHIMIRAYSTYSGVTLTGSFTEPLRGRQLRFLGQRHGPLGLHRQYRELYLQRRCLCFDADDRDLGWHRRCRSLRPPRLGADDVDLRLSSVQVGEQRDLHVHPAAGRHVPHHDPGLLDLLRSRPHGQLRVASTRSML